MSIELYFFAYAKRAACRMPKLEGISRQSIPLCNNSKKHYYYCNGFNALGGMIKSIFTTKATRRHKYRHLKKKHQAVRKNYYYSWTVRCFDRGLMRLSVADLEYLYDVAWDLEKQDVAALTYEEPYEYSKECYLREMIEEAETDQMLRLTGKELEYCKAYIKEMKAELEDEIKGPKLSDFKHCKTVREVLLEHSKAHNFADYSYLKEKDGAVTEAMVRNHLANNQFIYDPEKFRLAVKEMLHDIRKGNAVFCTIL